MSVITTVVAFLKLVPDIYRIGHSIFKLWKKESIKKSKADFEKAKKVSEKTNDTSELEEMFK